MIQYNLVSCKAQYIIPVREMCLSIFLYHWTNLKCIKKYYLILTTVNDELNGLANIITAELPTMSFELVYYY